ncbi:MAG: NAD-dependent epimerase/dehydratase family protein [Pseudomonadota bacterium]
MIDATNHAVSADPIAITGATGFIGSHLLSCLHDLDQPSRVLIRDKRNRGLNVPGSTEIISGSLTDHDSVLNLLKGTQACIHLAGATTSIDISGFHRANVVGTDTMAACAMACGVKHFIYISSQAARAPFISNYAASKALGEAVLSRFRSKMKITIIRPPAVIGPGDPMLQPMLDLIRRGWLPAPAEPKGKTRQFALISVRDLVSEIVRRLNDPQKTDSVVEPCSIPVATWDQIGSTTSAVLDRKVTVMRVWPGLMKGIGLCADTLARLTRRPLPISYNKVREMLAVDWTYDRAVQDAMTLHEMFAVCLRDE